MNQSASSMALAVLIVLIIPLTAKALQVKVIPANPKLGDTLWLMAQYDNQTISATPQVLMGQQTFQTFLIGPNQFRALLPTTPLDKPGNLKLQVVGGGEKAEVTVKLGDRKFPTQSIWLSGKGSEGTDYEFDRVEAFKKLVTPEKFWRGKFLRPNQGPVTAGYGIRRYYNGVFAKDYFHRGVDYAGSHGSPVVSPAPGKVALVGRVFQKFKLHGNTIGIDHGQGVTTIYLHLSRIDVKEGDWVEAGQVIGAIGATGAVTGPHLHWGFYVNGLSVDPAAWRDKGFE
jgi:murein DD-endopeptidase MepM/ murein hydrolase activator NlpD